MQGHVLAKRTLSFFPPLPLPSPWTNKVGGCERGGGVLKREKRRREVNSSLHRYQCSSSALLCPALPRLALPCRIGLALLSACPSSLPLSQGEAGPGKAGQGRARPGRSPAPFSWLPPRMVVIAEVGGGRRRRKWSEEEECQVLESIPGPGGKSGILELKGLGRECLLREFLPLARIYDKLFSPKRSLCSVNCPLAL